MKDYWEKRYIREEKIWGITPSKTAEYALKLFRDNKVQKILIPGSGYGRNSRLFSENGFDVTGIEISKKAFYIAQKFDPLTKFYNGSVLDMPFDNNIYDGVYCHNTLHLFLKNERVLFLKNCNSQLRNNGFVFYAVFSEKENSYGKGKEIEKHTFESKPGRPIHYFSETDLIEHFREYSIIKAGFLKDKENHGELGPHTHILRYIFAQK